MSRHLACARRGWHRAAAGCCAAERCATALTGTRRRSIVWTGGAAWMVVTVSACLAGAGKNGGRGVLRRGCAEREGHGHGWRTRIERGGGADGRRRGRGGCRPGRLVHALPTGQGRFFEQGARIR